MFTLGLTTRIYCVLVDGEVVTGAEPDDDGIIFPGICFHFFQIVVNISKENYF